jgi:selenocysteine lyase/cysteine desulfurase
LLAPSEYDGTPTRGYLDSATYGLPPRSTLVAMEEALAGWRTGRRWRDWEEDGEACRALFAGLVGARAEDIALVGTTSVATGLVAAGLLPAEPGANVVLYERDFTSAMLPFRSLEGRGVELRLAPLERLAEAVDERTALVSVSLVQSAEGRVVDLDALRATGARILLDATQAVGSYPVDLAGVDYLVAHGYKWLLCPRGLTFFYVAPERRLELDPLTAGWKSRLDPYEDYYGLPELTDDARRLDVSLPWFSAAGGRRSLELFADLGIGRIAEHNLGLATTLTRELDLPEPESPIVRLRVEDPEGAAQRLQEAGIACAVRGGSVRLSFHLYNDETDVELAAAALRPAGVGTPGR